MFKRGRRLRTNSNIRDLVRENTLTSNDFIFPIFVVEGENIKKEISSIKGNYHYSLDRLDEIIKEVEKCNIKGVIVFGVPNKKDSKGSEAYNKNGIVQNAVRKIKKLNPNLYVVTDVCMCQYTDHGHCGILKDEIVCNDVTIEYLGQIALSHVKAGADMVAPSDMMDGRIQFIRQTLDENGFENIPIMSYSAKYSSAFYGPFREAANSKPQFGDRKSYQMDPANSDEALREIYADIEEGADIVMIKPALSYLDIVRRVKDNTNHPICVYNVSGEFAMVKSASSMNLINEKSVALEMLLSMKRAGADIIITYYALEASRWLKEN